MEVTSKSFIHHAEFSHEWVFKEWNEKVHDLVENEVSFNVLPDKRFTLKMEKKELKKIFVYLKSGIDNTVEIKGVNCTFHNGDQYSDASEDMSILRTAELVDHIILQPTVSEFLFSFELQGHQPKMLTIRTKFNLNFKEKVQIEFQSKEEELNESETGEEPKAKGLGQNTDFTLVCRGQRFPCHRSVLEEHSPVFKQMLSNGAFIENQTNEMIIKDSEPGVIKAFVVYLYTEEWDEKKLTNLLMLAQKYEVMPLKQKCELELVDYVENKNVAHYYKVSSQYECKGLKKRCLEIISQNPRHFIYTDGWKELKKDLHPSDLMELFELVCKKADSHNLPDFSPYPFDG